MKKVIEVDGMCCKKCAERAERKLRLLDGVTNARANFKKQIIFVQTDLPDEMRDAGGFYGEGNPCTQRNFRLIAQIRFTKPCVCDIIETTFIFGVEERRVRCKAKSTESFRAVKGNG